MNILLTFGLRRAMYIRYHLGSFVNSANSQSVALHGCFEMLDQLPSHEIRRPSVYMMLVY